MMKELKGGDTFTISDLRNFLNTFSNWDCEVTNVSPALADFINRMNAEAIAATAYAEMHEII